MQAKLTDGSVMISGGCAKDAELKLVGGDGKRCCKVGVAVGKDRDGAAIWANVVAWHGMASVLSMAKKGDPVFVIGRLESREYNGKPYTDLVAEFVSVCSVSAVSVMPTTAQVTLAELSDTDETGDKLPF